MKSKNFVVRILSLIRKIENDPNEAAFGYSGRKEEAQVCFDKTIELENK